MTYEEYEAVLHTPIEELRLEFGENGGLMKKACLHYCELRKLDRSGKGVAVVSANAAPVIETEIVGELVEYYFEKKRGRVKICGYPIKGMPKGFRCMRCAGHGTYHSGFGHCKEHEKLMNNDEQQAFWAKLRIEYANVPSFKDMIDRSQILSEMTLTDMDADLHYVEMARQILLGKLSANTDNTSEPARKDRIELMELSDIASKIKERKKKCEQLNYIPPEQVGVMILQVLDFVTKNEPADVRARIAAKAQSLDNIFVPRIEANPKEVQLPGHVQTDQVADAVYKAKKIIRDEGAFAWGQAMNPAERPEGVHKNAYRHNHRFPDGKKGKMVDIPKPPIKLNLKVKS